MVATNNSREKLPGRFSRLVEMMPPRAIVDERDYENTVAMIDRLMASSHVTKGQQLYLETLVQLVQAYESQHHSIDTADLSGLDALHHLLAEHEMTASDLARLLGVHASMGSKILQGQRSLTVEHVRRLAAHFHISPELFIG